MDIQPAEDNTQFQEYEDAKAKALAEAEAKFDKEYWAQKEGEAIDVKVQRALGGLYPKCYDYCVSPMRIILWNAIGETISACPIRELENEGFPISMVDMQFGKPRIHFSLFKI